ncbi:MAG TPA: DUF4202 domain-containing protein [Rhodothermales bacterium]
MNTDPRIVEAIARFDAENAKDPRQEVWNGESYPRELLYAMRMTERLDAFEPRASNALRLAARCQHIRRWEIPRSKYPMDRTGYRRWRSELAAFHAAIAEDILVQCGNDVDTVQRVSDLVRKRRLKKDPEAQTLEDVACLVFLEHYFEEFAREHDREKVIEILRKTWVKMSERGREAALALNLSPESRALVEEAID